MNNKSQLLLGAFFLVVLGILGYYTLFLTEFSLFKRAAPRSIVHFPEPTACARATRCSSPACAAGASRRWPSIRRPTRAAHHGRAQARRAGPAARRVRDLDRGRHAARGQAGDDRPRPGGRRTRPEGAQLFGTLQPSPLAGLGDLIAESRGSFSRILADVEAVTAELRAGSGLLGRLINDEELSSEVSGGLSSASATFANLEQVTNRVNAGEGVLGRLVADQELADEFETVATNLRDLTADLKLTAADLREGRGTLGRLFQDEVLADDVAKTASSLSEITGRINAGEGTAGRLVNDPEIADRIESILAKADEGEGVFGRFLNDEEFYAKLDQVADDLSAASAAIRAGDGTLGKLVMDDELYNQIQEALNVVTRASRSTARRRRSRPSPACSSGPSRSPAGRPGARSTCRPGRPRRARGLRPPPVRGWSRPAWPGSRPRRRAPRAGRRRSG